MKWFWVILTIFQGVVAGRFVARLLRSLPGETIDVECIPNHEVGSVAVILPVLDEETRIERCLKGLIAQPPSVNQILVIDGGSTDLTSSIVERWSSIDPRIMLVNAAPVPEAWNGKAWGLHVGYLNVADGVDWIVTVDADVTVSGDVVPSIIDYAANHDLDCLSVACEQRVATLGTSFLHPSLLATLVYRHGVPSGLANSLDQVQANGQFMVLRRRALDRVAGFSRVRDSICEDFTLARFMYLSGERVSFVEAPGVARTEMHPNGQELLENWPRSLTLRDSIRPGAGIDGLANIIALQVVPLVIAVMWIIGFQIPRSSAILNRALLGTRLGILFGTRRAYVQPRAAFWLSPLADPITFFVYVRSLMRREHSWRGRRLVSQ